MMRHFMIGKRRNLIATFSIAICVLAFHTDRALAVSRDYVIDPTQSSVAISGTVQATVSGIPFNSPINSQGTGTQGGNSLFTRYTGTIKTDRDVSLISFLSGSAIDANVNGNWAPLPDASSNSTAPADYGG